MGEEELLAFIDVIKLFPIIIILLHSCLFFYKFIKVSSMLISIVSSTARVLQMYYNHYS